MRYCSFLALVGVTAFYIENDDVGGGLHTEPDTFGGLSNSLFPVEYIKICAEECVEKCAFAWALRADDGYDLVLFLIEPMGFFG